MKTRLLDRSAMSSYHLEIYYCHPRSEDAPGSIKLRALKDQWKMLLTPDQATSFQKIELQIIENPRNTDKQNWFLFQKGFRCSDANDTPGKRELQQRLESESNFVGNVVYKIYSSTPPPKVPRGQMFTFPENVKTSNDKVQTLESRGVIGGNSIFGGFFLSNDAAPVTMVDLKKQYQTTMLLLSTVVSCNRGSFLVAGVDDVDSKLMQMHSSLYNRMYSLFGEWEDSDWLMQVFSDMKSIFHDTKDNTEDYTLEPTNDYEELKPAMRAISLISSWLMTQKDDQYNGFMSVAQICMQFQKVRQFVLAELRHTKHSYEKSEKEGHFDLPIGSGPAAPAAVETEMVTETETAPVQVSAASLTPTASGGALFTSLMHIIES